MPIIIPKPQPPAPPPPAPPAPPILTMADVQAMLAQRDMIWMQKLDALRTEMTNAMAAIKPEPRMGATITFKKDHQGVIERAEIVPIKAR